MGPGHIDLLEAAASLGWGLPPLLDHQERRRFGPAAWGLRRWRTTKAPAALGLRPPPLEDHRGCGGIGAGASSALGPLRPPPHLGRGALAAFGLLAPLPLWGRSLRCFGSDEAPADTPQVGMHTFGASPFVGLGGGGGFRGLLGARGGGGVARAVDSAYTIPLAKFDGGFSLLGGGPAGGPRTPPQRASRSPAPSLHVTASWTHGRRWSSRLGQIDPCPWGIPPQAAALGRCNRGPPTSNLVHPLWTPLIGSGPSLSSSMGCLPVHRWKLDPTFHWAPQPRYTGPTTRLPMGDWYAYAPLWEDVKPTLVRTQHH